MYSAGDHSPVSHVSSVSSLSSHSSSSSESGPESGGRQKRKQSADGIPTEANGLEHSPTDTAGTAKGKGKAANKKQRANSTGATASSNNNKAKTNAKTSPVLTTDPTAAIKGRSSQPTPSATFLGATPAAATTNGMTLDRVYDSTPVPSVRRAGDRGESTNVAWPIHVATYNAMQQYFVSLILAMKDPDNQTVTDIIHLIAHAMEVAPEKSIQSLLRQLGYVASPSTAESGASSDDANYRRVVWRTPNPLLPYMTLPHHFRLNWSVSPETTLPEDTSIINFPTLCWWRAKEVRFVRRSDGFVQALETHFHPNPNCTPARTQTAASTLPQPSDSPFSTCDSSSAATPTPQTPATPGPEPSSPSSDLSSIPILSPSEIDMSVLDLPCHVEVNSAFERMFGYSQSEIRLLFIRHGKQAMGRLADAQQFRQCHELSMREASEGQQEFSHVIDVRPKYGGTMKTIMHHKLVVGSEGLVWKKLYTWIPLTKSMKEAYIASKMQTAAAGTVAATNSVDQAFCALMDGKDGPGSVQHNGGTR